MTRPGVRSRDDGVLFFVFLGPLVGWAVFLLPLILPVFTAGPGFGDSDPLDIVSASLMVVGLSLSVSYVLGFLPAWLTGLAWARLTGRTPLQRMALCAATGAGLTALIPSLSGGLALAPKFAAVGAAAALACSLLALGEERRARG